MMKKVCHLTSAHTRYDNRVLKRECVALSDNGYDVTLVVNDDKPDETYRGVKIVSTGKSFLGNRLKRMLSGVKSVYNKGLEADADIYHIHDPELLLIAMKLKERGRKVIFDSHEAYGVQILSKDYLPKLIRGIISDVYFRYETYISRRIDAIIAPCSVEESGIDRKYSFENRCRRVGYVNTYPRKEELDFDKNRKGIVGRSVCYSGGITYSRGIEHLIRAAEIAKANLLIAGKFQSQTYGEKILNLIEGTDAEYRGFLDSRELSELYNESTIGMCTLLPIGQYDKMGNLPSKAYEYMGMGLPMIISDFPYNRKFVKKYNVGLLVDPMSEKDIAEKMEYLFANPDEAKEMGENGRKVFLEKYNWDVAEKELLNIYKHL